MRKTTKRKCEDGGNLGDNKPEWLGGVSQAATGIFGLTAEGGKSNEQKGQAIGQTVGGLTALIPGIGPILSSVLTPLLGSVGGLIGAPKDMQNQMNAQYGQLKNNVTPFALGGALTNASSDFAKYSGNTHAQGGIDINAKGYPGPGNVNVEDDEAVVNYTSLSGNKLNFVFSKRLKI